MAENTLIIKLKQTLSNLPELSDRLREWNKLIKELDYKERNDLNSSIFELETNSNLMDLETCLMLCEDSYNFYYTLLLSLLSRLELPILAYKEKISELSYSDFKIKMRSFRIKEEKRCKDKAEELAQKYYSEFNENRSNKWDYIKSASGMVTPFLFQPGIYPCKDAEERSIFHKAFEGFNPILYVSVFDKKLKEFFKS